VTEHVLEGFASGPPSHLGTQDTEFVLGNVPIKLKVKIQATLSQSINLFMNMRFIY
jgi:hypothetical protein